MLGVPKRKYWHKRKVSAGRSRIPQQKPERIFCHFILKEMRRATITGAPQNYSLGPESSRSTLSEDPRKRGREIRDRAYQQECANIVAGFLAQREYDRPLAASALINPSLRDFQSIFRFIHSFIDPAPELGKKFEEEVMQFLKGIKYARASEINKSQLIAITPHSWPVLLSMLAALVEIVYGLEEMLEEDGEEEEEKKVFYNYLYKEYAFYTAGAEENSTADAELQREIDRISKHKKEALAEQRRETERVNREIEKILEMEQELRNLQDQKEQAQKDILKLSVLRKQQEAQELKYRTMEIEAANHLARLQEELAQLHQLNLQLEQEVAMQKIKPEDIKEMTEERDALVLALEGLRSTRAGLASELDALRKRTAALSAEIERNIFAIGSLNLETPVEISIRKNTHAPEFAPVGIGGDNLPNSSLDFSPGLGMFAGRQMDSVENSLSVTGSPEGLLLVGDVFAEQEKARIKLEQEMQEIAQIEENISSQKEIGAALLEMKRQLSLEIESKEEKIRALAALYIEKKEASDEEYRVATHRLDKAETELLKILAEGDNGLFQVEQKLEKLKIKKGRVWGSIVTEEAEVQRLTALVAACKQSLHDRIHEACLALE